VIEQYFAEGPGIDAAHQKALRDIHLGKKQEGSMMNKSLIGKKLLAS